MRLRARIQRRPVETVSLDEQGRRMDAMLENLDQLELTRIAARWPLDGGPGPVDHERHIEAPAREAERARLAEQLRIIDAHRAALPRGGASVLERASAYLARADGTIGGSGAHSALQSIVYRVTRGFLLPEPVALDLLMREYVPRCSPRWPLYEVRRSVHGAARRGGEGGWLLEGRGR